MFCLLSNEIEVFLTGNFDRQFLLSRLGHFNAKGVEKYPYSNCNEATSDIVSGIRYRSAYFFTIAIPTIKFSKHSGNCSATSFVSSNIFLD